jgi:hypothetical protein
MIGGELVLKIAKMIKEGKGIKDLMQEFRWSKKTAKVRKSLIKKVLSSLHID